MIAELASILRSIDAAANDPSTLEDVLSAMLDTQEHIFSGAMLFKGGYAGRSFVLCNVRGQTYQEARSWLRWPMRRLFARMKPARIRHPRGTGEFALAIPFADGSARSVVLAPIAGAALDARHFNFFAILESVTVPETNIAARVAAHIPVTPREPAMVAFGLPDTLYARIDGLLRQRGWAIDCIHTLGDLWRRLEQSVPDIIALDIDAIPEPVVTLAAIHRRADSPVLRVLAFGSEHPNGREVLAVADEFLSPDASSEKLFRAFKGLIRDVGMLRGWHAAEADAETRRRAAAALTPQELADFGAMSAAELMQGWASVILVNEYGAVYRAEYPARARPLLTAMPKTVFDDAPTFSLRGDEDFLREITDSVPDRMAMTALQLYSGASIPFVSADRLRRGVVVGCSQVPRQSTEAFEDLDSFVRILGDRFDSLAPSRGSLPEFRHERFWERLRDRGLGLDVYRSTECFMPWRYRMFGEAGGLLTIGVDDDGALHRVVSGTDAMPERAMAECLTRSKPRGACFAATIDFAQRSMRYATRDFPPPIVMNRSGPSGVVQTAGTLTTGVAAIQDGAIVCDGRLWSWLHGRGENITALSAMLEHEKPSGLASIVRLGCRN